jgi:Bacterial PH domain
MKFRVNFKNNSRSIGLAGMILWVLLGGLVQHNIIIMIITGINLIAITFVIVEVIRFYVVVTDERLEARNFFSFRQIRWADIHEVKIKRNFKENSIMPLLFRREIHEFITVDTVVKINFSLFSRVCYDEVLKRVPAR